jgi:hypothetical protein
MIRHGFTDRLFNRFALGNRAFRRFCFDRECERNENKFEPQRENLFLAGVARSGSTTLLNCLYESGVFASTCYRHMPFVMAPSLSKLVAAIPRKTVTATERRHGDGIKVDLDSPEALDGVFWSTYLDREEDRILPCDPGEELLRRYAMSIENLLLHSARNRYLSKMNQRIELLPGLALYFERSLFLLPFRDPLQQAASLLRQHRNFARLSAYEADYLGWLGHCEFGATHLGFYESRAQTISKFPIESLDYWLEQWQNVYSYLSRLSDRHPNLIPLCYERLAGSTSAWRKLSQRIGIEVSGDQFSNRNDASIESTARFDASLMDSCQALYARLLEQDRACSC